ncbi:LOW QUALITY PROTEIN: uncharacterized protein LOC131663271 [Phymastichus coffea]|uniref:LOW QUALITY PROTEIN: uncharacterized protein LOC131663271 n=1 Tax=Phymastichus coffea TaxID=108790 RepID=UPI00273BD46A|nr:LOW QUALITY PROTEIN: uncharacterized protein LOC131663271 [Phymastichus coffea]
MIDLSQQIGDLRQVEKAREAIQQKYNLLKLDRLEKEKEDDDEKVSYDVEQLFEKEKKPLEKLSDKDGGLDEASNAYELQENDDIVEFHTPESDYLNKYLSMLQRNQVTSLDTIYGVRKWKDDSFMIGDRPLNFEGDKIVIGRDTYEKSPGLIELLFKKKPDTSIITEDELDTYGRIIKKTTAHKKYYKPEEDIRYQTSDKFRDIISKLIEETPVNSSSGRGFSLKSPKIENKRKTVVEELYKPARRNYLRRSFDIRDIDEIWQIDLVEMIPYERENKSYKYILCAIDSFSKYAWCVAVKQKTGKDVAKAMESIFVKGRVPKKICLDKGHEFYNKDFNSLMTKHNIHIYSTYSKFKASICERFSKTLKNKMWKKFSLNGNYKWLDILPDLVSQYNNSKHRTIGMKPSEVTAAKVPDILNRLSLKKHRPLTKRAKFKVGDKVRQQVRVSKSKQIFEKGYTPNWSTEIFTIDRVMKTVPFTYRLKDYQDKPIAGGFYEKELLRTKYPDIYLIEKVVRQRGDHYYVKWLGFDESHNSYVHKDDM